MKTQKICCRFLFIVTVVVLNNQSAKADSASLSQMQTIPNYSIPTSEETTVRFQLSVPSEQIPPDNVEKQLTPNSSKSVLDSLAPNPNPLQYPTKPEEVQIQKIQAITLEQALELARRNNQELQVSLLELERAQAAVKEAQASLLPSAGLSAEFGRQQSAQNQLAVESTNIGSDEATTAFNSSLQVNYDLYRTHLVSFLEIQRL